MNFLKPVKYLILVSIVVLLSLFVGSGFSKNRSAGNQEIYDELQLFAEILSKVQNNYVEEVDPQQLIHSAIRGMLATLDPYSQFMDIEQYQDLESDTKGEFGGLGIRIIIQDNWLTVESPMEGTPAFRSGIKSRDRIVTIDGESTEGITLEQAVRKLRGPKGTQVTIGIMREGYRNPLIFNITREIIIIESIRVLTYQVENMNIGYIRIMEFREKTPIDLVNALTKLETEGIDGLILDLRYNPGGLLKTAIEVVDIFLPANKVVVSTQGRTAGQDLIYKTTNRETKFLNIPMVCLVNEGSASASEIVAGALQDHKRAIIIGHKGNRTFGKGSVQSVIELRNRTALRLTTARYYTPEGRSIDGKGLESDIYVEIPKEVEESILVAGKLGDLTVPKAIRTLQEDSTYKYITSETETVDDLHIKKGIEILQQEEYFPEPGIVHIPPADIPATMPTAEKTESTPTTLP